MSEAYASRGHPFGLRLLAAYVVALAAAQALTIAASLGRVTVGRAVGLAILGVAIALGVAYFRALHPAPRCAGPCAAWLAKGLAIFVVSIAAALFALTLVAALAKPDFSWDGNSYHIPTIHMWARRGYIHWIDYDHDPGPVWARYTYGLLNGYPKGAETVSFLLVRAAAASAPVNAANLVFLPLGITGIFVVARRLGATRWSSATAGFAFALVPIVVSQSATCYVDSSLASSVGGLMGTLAAVLPSLLRRRTPWELVPALGGAVGLAASAKSSGVVPAALALALVFVVALVAARRRPTIESRRLMARVTGFAGAALVVAALVAAYWYGRSWYHAANPMSPVRVTLLGHEIFPGMPLKVAISEEGNTPRYMVAWPGWKRVAFTWLQGLRMWPESIRWYDARDGGFGFLWVLACIPSALFVLARFGVDFARLRRSKVRLVVLVSILVLVGGSFAVTPMSWWSRYTVWVYAAGLPCVAVAIDHVGRARSRTVRGVLGLWLVGAFSLASYETWYSFRHVAFGRGFLNTARPTTPLEAIRALTTSPGPRYFFWNLSPMDVEVVISDDNVALGPVNVESMPILGQLSMPVGRRDLVLLSKDDGNDESRLHAICERHHVRYVFWPDEDATPAPVLHLARRQDRTIGFWRVYDLGAPRPHEHDDTRPK